MPDSAPAHGVCRSVRFPRLFRVNRGPMEAIETRYRTHTCGQLRKSDDKKRVKLAGWVHSYRDHGGLVFIDLRDRDGLTQLVFDPDSCGKESHEKSRHLRSEWVISVEGEVEPRGQGLE